MTGKEEGQKRKVEKGRRKGDMGQILGHCHHPCLCIPWEALLSGIEEEG